MKTCETCTHWKTKQEYDYNSLRTLAAPHVFGQCQRAIPLWDASEYVDTPDNDYVRQLTEPNKDRKFFAQDGSDYHAVVVTRDDFGCVEHEVATNSG